MSHPTAIIVDDEVTLIHYLSSKLELAWPELEIVGTAVNGRQAIALASETQPDIVFLDIHMPGLNGLQVAEALPKDAKVIFVTAYDQYAVDAFERAAVDYLLKPVSEERLRKTAKKVSAAENTKKDEILSVLREFAPNADKQHLTWLRTGLNETTELVSVDEVIYLQAEQKYTSVYTANREHIIRMSIKELAASLDPDVFWRIHRGTIVRVDEIVKAVRDLRGRYTLTLRSRNETLRTSQTYGHLFKQM